MKDFKNTKSYVTKSHSFVASVADGLGILAIAITGYVLCVMVFCK